MFWLRFWLFVGKWQPGLTSTQIFSRVNADSVFGSGTVLRTSPNAGLDLILVPGILVRLFESSELKIEELTLVKDGNEPPAECAAGPLASG